MAHEPGRLVCDAKHTVQLMSRYRRLRGTNQMRGEKPFVQRYLAALVDRAHGDGKLLPAGAALIETGTVRLALHGSRFVYDAAMRAFGAIGPTLRLKIFAGLGFISKD